jgi:hypothetical protein
VDDVCSIPTILFRWYSIQRNLLLSHKGIKINSPHYLLKLDLDAGEHHLTLVVSQYEKSTTIRYSIKAYSSEPFTLLSLPPPYPPSGEQRITSEVGVFLLSL